MPNSYLDRHLQFLSALLESVRNSEPFSALTTSADDIRFLQRLESLAGGPDTDQDFYQNGQQLMCRIIASYPHITPRIHRDLLWFFSGDCLHYLSDDEITAYQNLDEWRYEAEAKGETFDYDAARQRAFKLH